LIDEVGKALDHWVDTNWMYPEMRYFIQGFTTEQLHETAAWCKRVEPALYSSGRDARSKVFAKAPAFITDAFEAHRVGKARRRAKEEIETVLRKQAHAKEWDRFEVADTEIDARLRGDSIADILAKGTLIPCEECNGRGRIDCGVCGSEQVKCGVCHGKARVPAPMGRADPADFAALCRTLDVEIKDGTVAGGAPLTFTPESTPDGAKPSGLSALRAEAAKAMVSEARVLQSPKTKKALRDAGVTR
jgi:hypothetical protein